MTRVEAPLPAPQLIPHHDDPPCETRLDQSGFCPNCEHTPNKENTALRFYCSECKVLLGDMKCPRCNRIFTHPEPD